MICPNCSNQLVQYEKQGVGTAEEQLYITAELKQCPKCKKKFIEFYTTFELVSENKQEFNHYALKEIENYLITLMSW